MAVFLYDVMVTEIYVLEARERSWCACVCNLELRCRFQLQIKWIRASR